jgi:hypothetical protein
MSVPTAPGSTPTRRAAKTSGAVYEITGSGRRKCGASAKTPRARQGSGLGLNHRTTSPSVDLYLIGSDATLVQYYGSLNAGSGSKRARSSSIPARPYVCRFSILRRLSCPSTGPLLRGSLTADSTALRSCFNGKRCSKDDVTTTDFQSLLSEDHRRRAIRFVLAKSPRP